MALKNINSILIEKKYYYLIFFLIIVSSDTFFWGTNSVKMLVSVPRYAAIPFAIYLLSRKCNCDNKSFNIAVLITMLLLYLVSCYLHEETITITGIFFIYILLAYLIATRIQYNKFWATFDSILCFLAVYALFIEFIAYLFPSVIDMFPRTVNTAGFEIYNMFFCGIAKIEIATNTIRTNSIFWEPGVFQVYLNLAVAYQLFIAERVNFKRVFIYSLCILFTFSTSGYIVLIYLLFIFSIFTNNLFVKKYKIYILTLLCLILMLSMLSPVINEKVFSKLTEENNYSAVARYSSVISNIQIALENPLFGVGMGDMKELLGAKTLLNFDLYQDSNTNGILYPFAAYGIPFGILYVVGLIKFASIYSQRKYTKLLFFVFLILLFTGERLMSPLPYIMMFYGYTKDKIN